MRASKTIKNYYDHGYLIGGLIGGLKILIKLQ